jgi:hypothetical protein
MRRLAIALALGAVLAASIVPVRARADGSTIQLVPKRAPEPEPEPPLVDPPPLAPRPEPETEPDLELAPATPPPPLDRAPAAVQERRRGSAVAPVIGLGLSIAAGVAGAIFLVEAGRNLNSDNFTLEVQDSGDEITVVLTDEFKDAQNAVIANGIAGSVLVSTATAGLLASIIALSSRGR